MKTHPKALSFARVVLIAVTTGTLAACQAPHAALPAGPAIVLDLPVAQPPYRTVEANWKDRIDQPYVYVELHGDYRETGRAFADLARRMEAQGMRPSGAPFALFYDDPGRVPVAELRSRACLPVDRIVTPKAPLQTDVLASQTVVYAFVGGRYTDLPRAYHGLFSFMRKMNWSESGPVREIYLVPPVGAREQDLIAEVQIPVGWAK